MKKLNKLGYIAIGMVLVIIIGIATPAFAATQDVVKQLAAYFTSGGKPITVYVNGTKLAKDSNGKDVTPFTIDGTTYLPVRAISDALGKDVKWDDSTASVKINDKAASTSNTQDNNAKLTTTIDDKGNRHDKLDYTFTLDKDAVGEWEQIDFVKTFDQFDSTNTTRRNYIWPMTYSFYEDGKMITSSINGVNGPKVTHEYNWTKGYIIMNNSDTETVPSYEIKQLNGKTFMFAEWKSGDYVIRGQKPGYKVFVKTSDTPAPTPTATK